MAIVSEKRSLHFGVGEGGALTNPEWEVERFVVNEDGSREALGRKRVPATNEEIATQLSAAAAALQSQTSSLVQTIAAKDAEIASLTAQRDAARLAAQKVADADAAWEADVRPAVTAVLA